MARTNSKAAVAEGVAVDKVETVPNEFWVALAKETATVGKNDSGNQYRFEAAVSKQGNAMVNFREWYYDLREGVYKPGKSGAAIPVSCLSEMMIAFAQMGDLADRLREQVMATVPKG